LKARPIVALVLTLLLTPLALPAQESDLPKFSETIDVRVINIDVVVTDKRGNTISNLTADDFVVLENGRPQNITNFYEIRSDTAALEVREGTQTPVQIETAPQHLNRKIIFYIDNLTLTPFNRNRVFDSMKKFVHESMRPGDEAMLVTWNRSMKVRVPFTKDPKTIVQMLDALAGESGLGLHMITDRRQSQERIRTARDYVEALAIAREFSQAVEHDLRQSVAHLRSLMSTLAGVEGKKLLVMTTEGFPIQPGREMFYFIDDVRNEKGWTQSASVYMEGMTFNSTHVIESLAKAANSNGITLYTLHAGGLMAMGEGSAENMKPVSMAVQQATLTNSTESLSLLADLTGGIAVVGTNNFSGGFEKIRRDLNSYYSIGYRSPTERVDRQRSIEVRPKNRNHLVRSRRTFVEKSVPTEMTDRVIANLFHTSQANDLGIFITTGTPIQVERDRFKIPLDIHVPLDKLTLVPQGEVHMGSFSVYVGVSNRQGDMSDISNQSTRVRVPLDQINLITGKHFTYSLELLMEPGRNRISVGVVDDLAYTTGFERQEVLAADLR
jgi:VWFA-related protein